MPALGAATARPLRAALGAAGACFGLATGGAARAGDFDAQGNFTQDPAAAAFVGFETEPERHVPPGTPPECQEPLFVREELPDALEGSFAVRVDAQGSCAERFVLPVPGLAGSYRFRAFMRHGNVLAQATVSYPPESGIELTAARMFPTGRVTSDGWVELESNEVPIDGALAPLVYLRLVTGSSTVGGVQIDAVEVVPDGEFVTQPRACSGLSDPACTPEEVCWGGFCRIVRLGFPPLPPPEVRDPIIDSFLGLLDVHFGGHKTRTEDLPAARAVLEEMRAAPHATRFWQLWGKAIRTLHDWHTKPSVQLPVGSTRQLNVCFFEGEADLSGGAWPDHPKHRDVLVAYASTNKTMGLLPGDHLVAIDGLHPLAWAEQLVDIDWGHWIASDSGVYAELAERLRTLITDFATSFDVLRCDAATLTCAATPETILVSDIPPADGAINCDNRPGYHLENPWPDDPTYTWGGIPDPSNHWGPGWTIYQGRVVGTTPEEAIFGMTWDSLSTGGSTQSYVASTLLQAMTTWKAQARGVLLDHRAGNGGTLDGAELLTRLVRPYQVLAVVRMPMEVGGYDGPDTADEGLVIFEAYKGSTRVFRAGSVTADPTLPVALLLHRDGSASDFLPLGMKGAPRVRIFAPSRTAGAFSTFSEFGYWGGLGFQLASGDTIEHDGTPRIGAGVEPDEVVLPRQSDLVQGKDTLHETALAWLRTVLK